ncbi:SCAN domain-containing protein 3 [Trichonephila clavipes]|nr:SCAN domain-containing protein 3 [Trichonephila clavipes]
MSGHGCKLVASVTTNVVTTSVTTTSVILSLVSLKTHREEELMYVKSVAADSFPVADPTLNEIYEKVSELLDCPNISLEEFVAVDDNDVCTSPITAEKDILEGFFQSSKNITDADSDDENEMNNQLLFTRYPK